MPICKLWTRIITSRRTREREAAAQYERVHCEGVLRDEFARREHALEAQIAQAHAENCRLRAENRALLNSVLGIAGIPPVIVADPPATFIEGGSADAPQSAAKPDLSFVGAWHAMPGADAWRDAAHAPARLSADTRHDEDHPATAPPSRGRHSEERSDEEPLFVSPGYADAKPKRGPSGESGPQVDGAIDGSAASDCAASPSNSAGRSSATPLQNQTLDASTPHETKAQALQGPSPHASSSNAAPPQKQLRRALAAPRTRNDPHAIAPIRRRSWHQIYRMLEFESSRRKDQES